MKYRKLRIAFSAGCGIACVLLAVLWVRSYWRSDGMDGQVITHWTLYLGTEPGTGRMIILNASQNNWYFGERTGAWYEEAGQPSVTGPRLWGRLYFESNSVVGIPYWAIGSPFWLLILLSGVIALVPWIPWRRRFSLRTLLIGMTVVAVCFGLTAILAQ